MLLEVDNIEVVYSEVILVLKGLSIRVPEKGLVALLGANGAGKSTLLKAISGLLRPARGRVTRGEIKYCGQCINSLPAEERVRKGIVQIMEGRQVLEHLTTEENLIVGAYTRGRDSHVKQDMEMIYEYFPVLKERRHAVAGYLSGGEQQMLVIGRALLAKPRLMLLDEPSLGLSPLFAQEVFRIIKRLNKDEGISMLLVEQNTNMGLEVAQYGYIVENGVIVLDGPAEKLREHPNVKEFYLGVKETGDKRRFMDVKHYRRKKRWYSMAV